MRSNDVPTPSARPCRACGLELPRDVTNYHADPSCADGLRRVCRSCVCAEKRRRYRDDPQPQRDRVNHRRAERAELLKDSPQWQPTPRHQATDQLGSVAFS
jgi:hypothetical protein